MPSSVSTPADTRFDWEVGTGSILHRETRDYYQLLTIPEDGDLSPAHLTEFGVGADWTCEFETVGEVTVTHLRVPANRI